MAPRYRVIISPRALDDLQEIHTYIESQSPGNAAGMLGELLAAFDALELLPHRYPIYSARRQPSEAVRRMPVWPYLIYYQVNDATYAVRIVTIRHGSRRQPRHFD